MDYRRFKQNFSAVSDLASNALNAPLSWLPIKPDLNPAKGKFIRYIPAFSKEFAVADCIQARGDCGQAGSKAANFTSRVFAGEISKYHVYLHRADALDDPSALHPTFAIFAEDGPSSAIIPAGLQGLRRYAGVA
jgi:hypothetical protein